MSRILTLVNRLTKPEPINPTCSFCDLNESIAHVYSNVVLLVWFRLWLLLFVMLITFHTIGSNTGGV